MCKTSTLKTLKHIEGRLKYMEIPSHEYGLEDLIVQFL